MKEYRFLIPIVRNSNGQPHPSSLWTAFQYELNEHFGGYSKAGAPIMGQWRSEDGTLIGDKSVEYRVAAKLAVVVVQLLAKWCKRFDQQCIYLAFPNGDVQFVDANSTTPDSQLAVAADLTP